LPRFDWFSSLTSPICSCALIGAIYAPTAAHRSELKQGEAIRSCWRLFHERFGLSTHTDLPSARYDEAIQFIKEQYHGLTGQEINAAEQTGMEFDS
jgi:hypothetical protein